MKKLIVQQNGRMYQECDICGTPYPLVFKEHSKFFSTIPLSDSIRIELIEGTQTAIATFRVCPTCAGKVYGHIVQMKKDSGTTGVL